jgi:membrane protease YdiL (CAAX protease family)
MTVTDARMLTTGFLLAVLVTGSCTIWMLLIDRKRRGQPFVDFNEEPRTAWRAAMDLAVAFGAVLLLVSSLIPRLMASQPVEKVTPSLNSVAFQALMSITLSLILLLALASGERSWSRIGVTSNRIREQIRLGIRGFFATVIPMGISMAATAPFRGPENQHSLLKLLMESRETSTLALIAFTATIAAPLFEELMYRVILQSWLASLFSPTIVIPTIALAFSFSHGWRDGLALIPLALILGYVFHRSHSYLSVVVMHALFNLTMLALQLLNPRI